MNPSSKIPPMSNDFENSPNMIPGEVEVAQKYNRHSENGPQKSRSLWVTSFLTILVLGGWVYLRQDQLKEVLGTNTVAVSHAEKADFNAAALDHQSCPPQAGEAVSCVSDLQAPPGLETCCEQGKNSAMAAALLKPVNTEPEIALKPVSERKNADTEEISLAPETSTAQE